MRFKRKIPTAVSLILSIYFLASCVPSETIESATTYITEELFPEETSAPEITAEDIIYEYDSIPVVHLTTVNGVEATSRSTDVVCNFRIELNGIYSEYENTYTDENGGSAAIHIRGNSSAASEPKSKNKYSYKLKLDTKADLFGFGESKHWYLINNWFDVSALRNKLAYDFSGALGLP